MSETIYALSSGSLPSGVAVIRLSGPGVVHALEVVTGKVPVPRRMDLSIFRKADGSILDQGLVVYFPAPHSFTGLDCAEFHCHGGRAVVSAMMAVLAGIPSLRPAEPGEFTRQAFENGKLDLTEIEGLADLIDAETEMQRKLAIEQAAGGLTRLYGRWAETLVRSRALIEAELDFADEADVPGSVSDQVWKDVAALRAEMAGYTAHAGISEIIRDGFVVAIMGAPNAGKSSLMNALSRRDVAIVTEIAGTTRDVLAVDLDIGGYAVHLLDTAGLRETEDLVEAEGVRRAKAAIANANLVLHLDENGVFDSETFQWDVPVIRVMTKIDRHVNADHADGSVLKLSVTQGIGLDSLVKRISEHLSVMTSGGSQSIPLRSRHVNLLLETQSFLDRALSPKALELRAEDLRSASNRLGRITGRVDVEDLLDVIFSSFCIGK